jgi:hypothetical protein
MKIRSVRLDNRRKAFAVRATGGRPRRDGARRAGARVQQGLYALTLEAQKRVAASPLSRRELIRRLDTSATHFCRLLDQTNYRKSLEQLVSLLQILDCDVRLVVRSKPA